MTASPWDCPTGRGLSLLVQAGRGVFPRKSVRPMKAHISAARCGFSHAIGPAVFRHDFFVLHV